MNTREYENRLEKLNTEQRKAVETIYGPVMVVAGPGTGKTELLALRIARLLKEPGVRPQNILCLTFTDNAAINMRERLLPLVGAESYRVQIFTFHGFCNHIIARYPEYFFDGFSFAHASDVVQAEILEDIFKRLPFGHPYSAHHSELGYSYLRDIASRISAIKKAGMSAQEFGFVCERFVNEAEAVDKVLSTEWPDERLSIKKVDIFVSIAKKLYALDSTTSKRLASLLEKAVDKSIELGATAPLGDFKKKYLKLVDGKLTFVDLAKKKNILATAEIYTKYAETMHSLGYYNYDDMILEVKKMLQNHEGLRAELEEEYQFIMIDEFQDTNDAQMSIVKLISSSEIHEGRPNVCVVGDDDQAIYKFQGADISNILTFGNGVYRDVVTIVLDKNYRSTSEVLEIARKVVVQGKERLENRGTGITKVLSSENSKLPEGAIYIAKFEDPAIEYAYVAASIAEKIREGVNPKEIAIISRKHAPLMEVLPFLDAQHVPYEYTKKANVFDEPHIRALVVMCEYIASTLESGHRKDYLLPQILSFPFWGITRTDVWSVADIAKRKNISWIEAMQTEGGLIADIAVFLQEMSKQAEYTPLEILLDTLIGTRVVHQDGEYTDDEPEHREIHSFTSPFREYYFKGLKKEKETEYIYFLASLQTFIAALKEHKQGEILKAKDVMPFVEMHKLHNIPLVSSAPFITESESISLLTAHGSKGLEYEYVYIIAAEDAAWTKGGRGNKTSVPTVLEPLLQEAGETEDDYIRLLFVAITRAKHTLIITSHSELVRYLEGEIRERYAHTPVIQDDLETKLELYSLPHSPISPNEKLILAKLIEQYKMPVTHLTNFLDITSAGPEFFIEQNLLRFPQAKSKSGVYGSAVHAAIEEMVLYPKYKGGEKPTVTHLLAVFSSELAKGRLLDTEVAMLTTRGTQVITEFAERMKDYFTEKDAIEVDFKDEGIILDGAHLTGKIDFLREAGSGYEVVDFKTGSAATSWDEAKDEYMKVKLHKYELQLYFYYILLRESGRFSHKSVDKLSLWFVEEFVDGKVSELRLEIQKDTLERYERLISKVYSLITSLDFPDVSKYPKTYQGLLDFEADIIK